MGKIADFVAYLESHIGDAYVWGAQGRRVDTCLLYTSDAADEL